MKLSSSISLRLKALTPFNMRSAARHGRCVGRGSLAPRYAPPAAPSLLLESSRSGRGRAWGAGVSLGAFLLTQWLLPGAMLLQTAHAQEREQASRQQQAADRQRALGEKNSASARRVRLAQAERQERAQAERVQPSEPTACGTGDCDISVKALDLSRPPTETELRQAGGMGGALSPIGPADVSYWTPKFDSDLKKRGIAEGLQAPGDPETVPGRLVLDRKGRIEKLKKINLSFGEAMQEWNKHNYKKAAQMLRDHVKEFEDSPWNGEALLHLGCDSKYNGRFSEAASTYSKLLESTSGDAKSESFEIHQKAKLRWADLDIALGKVNDASRKLSNLIQTDNDWRRRTWAMHWLRNMGMYKKNFRDLRACGTRALGSLMADLGRNGAALRLAALKPTRADGFSLAELEKLAERNGVSMQGFRARPEQLASLPMPLLIHYDFSKAPAPLVSSAPRGSSEVLGGRLPVARFPVAGFANAAPSASPLASALTVPESFYRVSGRPGHFLVVQSVDARARVARMYDPQEKRRYTLAFSDLAKEWSGTGLMRTLTTPLSPSKLRAKSGAARVAMLSGAEMEQVIGGCCGVARPPADLGPPPQPKPPDCGSPSWAINPVNLNMYVSDTPLWYKSPVGPDVSITMSYNSQEATNQNDVFGNKWVFNYSSYLVEDTQTGGGVVTIFLPNSRQENFVPDGSGGYVSPVGNYSTLRKLSATRYEMAEQSGEKYIYDVPAGTTSLQAFLVEMRDPWGHALRFGYNADVKLTTITDATGRVTRVSYDADGYITRIDDPFERFASFKYDGNGNMIEVTDIEGNSFGYTYDADIYITSLNTVQGLWKFKSDLPAREFRTYGFDENYYVTITDPLNQIVKWGYDGAGGATYVIDAKGVRTSFTVGALIDGKGRITSTSFADGQVQSAAYDPASGQVAGTQSSAGDNLSIGYNNRGQIESITDALKRTTRILYAPNGIDAVGLVNARNKRMSTVQFNAFHQPTLVRDALNQAVSMSYTEWGALESLTDPKNSTLTYNYNRTTGSPDFGRVMSVERDGVRLASYTYDKLGRVQSETGADNKTQGYNYDELDTVTRVTYPDGTFSETLTACCGLPAVETHRNGSQTFYDYDPLKRLTRVQDAAGSTVEMEYDPNGNLEALVDSNKGRTRWQYDTVGRLVRKTYADGSFEGFGYDAPNRMLSRRDAQNRVTRSYFDEVGNLSRIDHPDAPDVTVLYDALNRPYEMRDGIGSTKYLYDDLNRVRSIDGPWQNDTQSFDYDAVNQRKWMQLQNPQAQGGVDEVRYGFDGLSRLQSLSSGAGTFGFGYKGNTSLAERLSLPNGTSTNWSYDALNRLNGVQNVATVGGAPSTFARYSYGYETPGYEKRSVRTWQEQQVGADPAKRFDYGYDRVNQLTGEKMQVAGQASPAFQSQWSYDKMGNRQVGSTTQAVAGGGARTTTASYTPNSLNQYVAAAYSFSDGSAPASSTCAYDPNGNLIQQTATTGSGAQATTTGSTRYAYDSLHRLSSITGYDPATGAPQRRSLFFYDGQSRKRVAKEALWQNARWVQTSELRYLYDGMDVIQERDASNQVLASYTRAGNIGGLLARTTYGTGGGYPAAAGSVYFHYDGSGNVSQLSDATGALVARHSYDAWGNTLEASGSAAASNRYRYSTKEQHGASGLYDFGFRFYSASLGKWINRDPLKEGGGMNLYAYAANNPVSFSDAYGLSPATAMQGFAVGLGVGLWAGFVVAASVGIVAGAFSGAGPIIAVVGGLLGAVGLADLLQQVREIEESNLCPDDKDYALGMLAGGFLGGFLGGGLGNKFKPRNDTCFVAGTLVTLADGIQKPIEEVKAGDKVLTRNEASGKDEVGEVKQTVKRTASSTWVLTLSNGERIETTEEHPFYVEGRGFTPAKEVGYRHQHRHPRGAERRSHQGRAQKPEHARL